MKSHLLHSSGQRAAARRRSVDARDVPSDYTTPGETRALAAGGLAYRTQRLSQADLVSSDEAAALTGTSRVTINAWIARGRCIGLTQTKRGYRLPAWQFEPLLWDSLPALSDALATRDGWALLAFLESPHGALDGRTPREAIEAGHAERVLGLARQEGH